MPRSLAKPIKVETCCVIPIGSQNPHEDDGNLRPWQKEALAHTSGSKRAVIIAPTGSGKSSVAKIRGAIKLAHDPKAKHLVSVPQTVIANSFTELDLDVEWPGVGKLSWCPSDSNKLVGTTETIDKLVQWLTRPARNTLAGRIMICTHQALVCAFKVLRRLDKLDALRDVLLTLDETHHSCADEYEKEIQNRLGEVVRHYFENDLQLDMFTATWMRSNYLGIIPPKYKSPEDYAKYVLPVDKYLEMEWPKGELSIRFLIGTPEDSLHHVFNEQVCRTITYLPPVRSSIMDRYTGKYSMLETLGSTLGSATREDPLVTYRSKGRSIRALDWVTESGRDSRKGWFLGVLREKKTECEPDLLWALNMGKEGFDWPAAERSVVIGPRGSMLDTIQMLGRLLRKYPGKTRIEFNIVLPFTGKDKEDPEAIRDYLKVMLASMVVEWQFRRPVLRTPRDNKVAHKVFVEEPTIGQQATGACLDAGINSGDDDDAVAATRREFDRVGIDLSDEEKDTLAPIVVGMFSGNLLSADDVECDLQLVKNVYGRVRSYCTKFGYRTLSDLREALGRKTLLTEDCITSWMEESYKIHGVWPHSGVTTPVPGQPKETWNGIENALQIGLRGLPGGSSIAKLREERFGVRNPKNLPSLTEDDIAFWMEEHHQIHGVWPTNRSKTPVPGQPGEKWVAIDGCLVEGDRGLPGGSSIAKLREERFGVRNRKNLPPLTEDDIAFWMEEHHQIHGVWPSSSSKTPVPGRPGEKWGNLDLYLRDGKVRGLPGGSSLAKLREEHFGVGSHLSQSPLVEDVITSWMEEYHRIHGVWPHCTTTNPVPGQPREGWENIDQSLWRGNRGLPGGSSLAKLRKEHFKAERPTIVTEKDVVTWMKEHHRIYGVWPSYHSKTLVPNQPEGTWSGIDQALRGGHRGLPGGSSLARLRKHLCVGTTV